VRPVRRVDAPYDDEITDRDVAVVTGSLALRFPPPVRAGVPLRLVPPAGPGFDEDDEDRPRRTGRADLPHPVPWSRRLTQAVAEVLAGARPASQLARFATLDVLAMLERGVGRLGSGPGDTRRPVVASVHLSEPRDGVAEVCAVVDTGPRRRAIALRLEGLDGRWWCTALQVG
jgi:hypothetical protein